MGYYSMGLRGDYYRGDYYRGDPGFLSFLGGIAKTVGGFIPGVGPLIQGAGEALSRAGAPKIAKGLGELPLGKALPAAIGTGVQRLKSTALKHPVLTGLGAAGLAAGVGAEAHKLLTRGGGERKRRRMRVTNPRALRRAIRRTTGFAKLAMRTIHLVHPRKKVRFGGFRRARKR